MAHVNSGEVRIHYDDRGRGEPALLLLPGWCANRKVFQSLAPLCGARRRTLALDWRGHGDSGTPSMDFGNKDLIEDALAVIRASGTQQVVPVAFAHSGWIALELRRKLGDQIPKLVLLDWHVVEAPSSFQRLLPELQSPDRWREAANWLLTFWLQGVSNPQLVWFVREEMGAFGFQMWARAAREISLALKEQGSPLQALARLSPPLPVLHLYGLPDDAGYLADQNAFAASHPWFKVQKLEAYSHLPMFEVPEDMAAAIEGFVA